MHKTLLIFVVALVLSLPFAASAQTTTVPKVRTPEPATILLVVGGVGAFAVARLRKRKPRD
jgi:PEP-CTERM motif